MMDIQTNREVWRAVLRATIAAAYSKQLRKGYTVKVIAARVSVSEKCIEKWMMVPGNMRLDELSDLLFGMNCEPEFSLANGTAALVIYPMPEPEGSTDDD